MQIPIESLNLLMLNVGYAQHDGDWNWKNVVSPFARIYCVTEGEARLHLPDRVVELKAGRLYMVPAYMVHSYECRSKFSHYYLHLYEGFKKESDVFEFYEFPYEVEAEAIDAQVFELMCAKYPFAELPASDPTKYDNQGMFHDYVRRYNDLPLHDKMQIRGCILMLFSRFMHLAKPRDWVENERMASVVRFIHSNIYRDIDVAELSSEVFITKQYLIRLFKKHFGISPLQYINRKKVERAQLLLITGNMPVKEMAYELGFNDHSYFIRLFKKITGSTPMEYRAKMK